MADAKRIQMNVPMTEEEKQRIQEAAQARGLSNSEFLRQAAQAAMLDDLAEAVPEQGDAIAEFQTMTERLTACYQAALEHSRDAYDRASAKVRDDLASLGELLRENKELKQRIEQLEQECQAAHEAASEAETMLNETAVDSGKIAELERKLMDAERKLLEVEKEHAIELKKVRDELEHKLLEAEKALVDAKADHMSQIETERKAHQDEIKRMVAEQARIQAVANEAESQRAQLTEARAQMTAMREQHEEAMARERQASHAEMMDALVKILQEHAK